MLGYPDRESHGLGLGVARGLKLSQALPWLEASPVLDVMKYLVYFILRVTWVHCAACGLSAFALLDGTGLAQLRAYGLNQVHGTW